MTAVTWNPSDASANVSLSGGNLTAGWSTVVEGSVRATLLRTAGRRYFEILRTTEGSPVGDQGCGVVLSTANLLTFPILATTAFLAFHSGAIWGNGVNTFTSLGTFVNGDVCAVAVNMDDKLIFFNKNGGGWNGGAANPVTGAGGLDLSSFFTTGTSLLSPTVTNSNNTNQVFTARFKQSSFTLSMPSGYFPWEDSPFHHRTLRGTGT